MNKISGGTNYTEEEYSLEKNNPFGNGKIDREFFKEENNVMHTLVRIKRNRHKASEGWVFWENNKQVFTIKISQVSDNNKSFLKTANGMQFLLDSYKAGNKTAEDMLKVLQERE